MKITTIFFLMLSLWRVSYGQDKGTKIGITEARYKELNQAKKDFENLTSKFEKDSLAMRKLQLKIDSVNTNLPLYENKYNKLKLKRKRFKDSITSLQSEKKEFEKKILKLEKNKEELPAYGTEILQSHESKRDSLKRVINNIQINPNVDSVAVDALMTEIGTLKRKKDSINQQLLSLQSTSSNQEAVKNQKSTQLGNLTQNEKTLLTQKGSLTKLASTQNSQMVHYRNTLESIKRKESIIKETQLRIESLSKKIPKYIQSRKYDIQATKTLLKLSTDLSKLTPSFDRSQLDAYLKLSEAIAVAKSVLNQPFKSTSVDKAKKALEEVTTFSDEQKADVNNYMTLLTEYCKMSSITALKIASSHAAISYSTSAAKKVLQDFLSDTEYPNFHYYIFLKRNVKYKLTHIDHQPSTIRVLDCQ